MKRVPKEIIEQMLSILYINDNKDITDLSSRSALEYAKAQAPEYRTTLYYGLYSLIKDYKKRQKLIKKQRKLIGND